MGKQNIYEEASERKQRALELKLSRVFKFDEKRILRFFQFLFVEMQQSFKHITLQETQKHCWKLVAEDKYVLLETLGGLFFVLREMKLESNIENKNSDFKYKRMYPFSYILETLLKKFLKEEKKNIV